MNDIEALRKWTYERMSEVLADPKLKTVIIITGDTDGEMQLQYKGGETTAELIEIINHAGIVILTRGKE